MDEINLALNDEDRAKVSELIKRAFYAGIEQGKKEERFNAECLQALNDLIKRQEEQQITVSPIVWPSTQGGGGNGLQPPYKVTC